MKHATGEYILFVDSDDYIDLDACEQFISALGKQKVDIVVGNARRFKNNNVTLMQHTTNTKGQLVSGEYYLKQELKAGTMYKVAWLNLYNKEFLLDNNLEFKVGILHEDEHFTPRVFLKAKTVLGTKVIFYNYLIREGSISTKKNQIQNAKDLVSICKELEHIYNKVEDNELRSLLIK